MKRQRKSGTNKARKTATITTRRSRPLPRYCACVATYHNDAGEDVRVTVAVTDLDTDRTVNLGEWWDEEMDIAEEGIMEIVNVYAPNVFIARLNQSVHLERCHECECGRYVHCAMTRENVRDMMANRPN